MDFSRKKKSYIIRNTEIQEELKNNKKDKYVGNIKYILTIKNKVTLSHGAQNMCRIKIHENNNRKGRTGINEVKVLE